MTVEAPNGDPRSPETADDTGRRTFLRGAAFAGLAALAGVLATRRPANPAKGETCTGQGYCRPCPALSTCGLPEATHPRGADS